MENDGVGDKKGRGEKGEKVYIMQIIIIVRGRPGEMAHMKNIGTGGKNEKGRGGKGEN